MATRAKLGSITRGDAKSYTDTPDDAGLHNSNSLDIPIIWVSSDNDDYTAGILHFKQTIDISWVVNDGYYAKQKLWWYVSNLNSSVSSLVYVSFTPSSSNLSWNPTSITGTSGSSTGYLKLNNVPTSWTELGSSNLCKVVSRQRDSISLTHKTQFKFYYGVATNNMGDYTTTTPNYTITYSGTMFTCSFDSNGGSGSFEDQIVYWGGYATNPGNPNPPSSINRTITVNFAPGSQANEASKSSDANLTDEYSFSGWSPSISTKIKSNTTFKATYSLNRDSKPVLIPYFSTGDGKPTRNGYIFNTWKYGSENAGSTPGSETLVSYGGDGGTSYTNNASWTETESTYYIYPAYKDGDEVKEITFKDDDGNTNTRIEFNLKWESSKAVSSIAFKSFLKNGLKVDSSKVYNMRDNSEVITITGKMADKEYYVLYDIIQDKVTLNLNGGNINGNTNNIVIPYNRFSEIISIKSDYKPSKYNTTFVAWYNSATNEYVSEIDPAEQEVWPSNITLTAEYIPIGTFVCRKDKAGKLYWEAIINKWVMHNGQWQGEYDIPGTDIVHTSTSFWILQDGEWKLEYGKQSLPLS